MKDSTRRERELSNKMGHTISGLIGIATELKHGTPHKRIRAIAIDDRLRLMDRQREQAIKRAADAERKLIELRRAKLANFSIDEIAQELQYRKELFDKAKQR